MVLALAIGVLLLIVYSPRPVVPPNVTITFDGYVRSSRLAAFTISNASPFTIAYSGHYRIQLRVDGGWSNLAEAWLPNGAEMRSGQSDSVTLIPPVGGREWRAEFDVFAHGYYASRGRRFTHELGQRVGLSLVEPVMYSKSSDSITESFDEVLEKHQKATDRSAPAAGEHHYVFFNRDRERISEAAFLETKAFEGAQLKYTWRELEPEKDGYDFNAIQQDLKFLTSKGKKLFVQLQDTSFDSNVVLVPRYLVNDPRYHGGADKQYTVENDDEEHATPAGWVARRWDPAVQERFHQLLFALGKEFDGRVEGINLPETAVDFGETGRLFPKGFTVEGYRDAVITNMMVLKRAFPKSVTMQYANFMPGEWLPDKDRAFLRSIYQRARELKVGVGGPDLLPYKPGQMNHCYPLIKACAGSIPTGIAVQEGNYEHQNPKTGRRVTISELISFGTEYLKVDYIFWCTQEPYYSEELLPFLQSER